MKECDAANSSETSFRVKPDDYATEDPSLLFHLHFIKEKAMERFRVHSPVQFYSSFSILCCLIDNPLRLLSVFSVLS